jgi:hypothetical protein
MSKFIKWLLIAGVVLIVLVFAASILWKTTIWEVLKVVFAWSLIVLFLGAIIGGAILHARHQRGRMDHFQSLLSQSWVSSLPFLEAFERVKQQIAVSHVGTNWWVLRVADPDAGYLLAMLQFPPGEGIAVQMVLGVRLSPSRISAETFVRLEWEVTHYTTEGTIKFLEQIIKFLEQMNGALRDALHVRNSGEDIH